jgi:hypothetical protein
LRYPNGTFARPNGRQLFTDGVPRPVYEDERGQFIEEDDERIDGVWLVPEEDLADTPVVVEGQRNWITLGIVDAPRRFRPRKPRSWLTHFTNSSCTYPACGSGIPAPSFAGTAQAERSHAVSARASRGLASPAGRPASERPHQRASACRRA